MDEIDSIDPDRSRERPAADREYLLNFGVCWAFGNVLFPIFCTLCTGAKSPCIGLQSKYLKIIKQWFSNWFKIFCKRSSHLTVPSAKLQLKVNYFTKYHSPTTFCLQQRHRFYRLGHRAPHLPILPWQSLSYLGIADCQPLCLLLILGHLEYTQDKIIFRINLWCVRPCQEVLHKDITVHNKPT